MEYVILGLLMIRDLSQYDMRNALQQKVSPFFSASLGSIQAALKKLEGNAHVEYTEVVENGRRKKVHSINRTGREYFIDWMLSSSTPNRLEQDATTRLFFLGFMPASDRIAIIKAVVSQLESIVQEFEESSIEANKKEVPEHLKLVIEFQFKTLDLGLFNHKSMLEWFTNLLIELEAQCDE